MKKLALLLVLTIVLAFSFTYATDTTIVPDSAAPAISGEVIEDNTVVNVSGENTANTDISGNDVEDETTDTPEDSSTTVSGEETHDHDSESTTSKSTVWGAVLAIVIVIAIVLVVALFSKND